MARAPWNRGAFVLAVVVAVLCLPAAPRAKSTGKPRRRAIDTVVVHSLGGPDCRDGTTFYKHIEGGAQEWMATFRRLPIVSIHYVIGRDGEVAAGIPEALAASHAIGLNQRSIGIELVNNGDGVDPFPPVQIAALVRLVQDIRARHPAVTPERVWRHSDVDQSLFPASQFGQACSVFRRKLDPGDAFPWDAFKAALAAPAQRVDGR